jgi:gliding motility-associated-like protein
MVRETWWQWLREATSWIMKALECTGMKNSSSAEDHYAQAHLPAVGTRLGPAWLLGSGSSRMGKMFKRMLVVLLLLAAVSRSNAAHIVGGEIYYDHLGGDQYRVYLTLFRDCTPGNTGFDAMARIGVFGGDFSALSVQTLSFPGATNVPVETNDPCLTVPPSLCLEASTYSGIFVLPPRPDGYILAYQRCCRAPSIVNVLNPVALGLTCTVSIPGSTPINSSPRFNAYPPAVLCLGSDVVFDHSASEADGDSLVYSLCTPFNGGTQANPAPNPPSAPPYTFLPWAPGYSAVYPMDASPIAAIDPTTGLLTLRPTQIASYVVAICVAEYRNGILLTESRRDFQFNVVPCNAQVTAVIEDQTVFCNGLTIEPVNNSINANTWSWDFGEPGLDTDTSSLASPSWTYSQPGTYTVTLIAGPGQVCADTTQVVFVVQDGLDPFFLVPDANCGALSTTLTAEGGQGPGATYQWQFGADAEPSSAVGSPVEVLFPATGTHTVILTVSENGCTESFTAEVVAYPQPTAQFEVDPPSPQSFGTSVVLLDISNGNGATITAWNWSVNGGPIGEGPTMEWIANTAGTNEIVLTITSADGCTSTFSVPYVIIQENIEVPNVFSPNGDGMNDRFNILNIEQHKNQLTIFNRWGMVVYQATDYRNQWAGGDLPEGTYFYDLVLEDGRTFAGPLTLLR